MESATDVSEGVAAAAAAPAPTAPTISYWAPFENLKVTTMTLIIPFSAHVRLDSIFWLLPISKLSSTFSTTADNPAKEKETPKRKAFVRPAPRLASAASASVTIDDDDLAAAAPSASVSVSESMEVEDGGASAAAAVVKKSGGGRKRSITRCKVPHCSIPGSILSARYQGNTRGIVRSSSSDHFKNSITIDVATREKNVSIKLCSSKIQMCGASSEEQGREGAQYILNHLKDIQAFLRRIRENRTRSEATSRWVLETTQGELDEHSTTIAAGETALVTRYKVRPVDITTLEFPDDSDVFDRVVAEKLIEISSCHTYHSDYEQLVRWILERVSQQDVYVVEGRDDIEITSVWTAMVNYNYDLGFEIRRNELRAAIHQRNGFIARFHNTLEYNVTVTYPYNQDAHEGMKRKNSNPCHTILFYKSGLVTQSSPSCAMAKNVYELLGETLREIYPLFAKPVQKAANGAPVARRTPKSVRVTTPTTAASSPPESKPAARADE